MSSLCNIKERNQGLLHLIFVIGLVSFFLTGILFTNELRVFGFLFGAIFTLLVLVTLFYIQTYQENKKRKIEDALNKIRISYQDQVTTQKEKIIDKKNVVPTISSLKGENVKHYGDNIVVTIWEAHGNISNDDDKLRYTLRTLNLPKRHFYNPNKRNLAGIKYQKHRSRRDMVAPRLFKQDKPVDRRIENSFYAQELIQFYVETASNPLKAKKTLQYLEEQIRFIKQKMETFEKESQI